MSPVYIRNSFYEKTARARIAALFGKDEFEEILPPGDTAISPHLAALGMTGSFDDGVVIGQGQLEGHRVYCFAQEGLFMGGAVGEIHGAKIVGLLLKAVQERPDAVVMLVDSGGVRLHEANAGLVAISEIMRAMLQVRAAGIPIVSVVAGTCGAFGGMGICTCLSDIIIMTEEGRLALSGPEVIETVKGVEEFDAKDRALVWRVTGGKNRYLMDHVQWLVEDDVMEIRQRLVSVISQAVPRDDQQLVVAQQQLEAQYRRWYGKRDGMEVWRELGIQQAEMIPMLPANEVISIKEEVRNGC